MGDAAGPSPPPGCPLPTITVTDPVKMGEGVASYVSYKVRSRGYEVSRRYSDFVWLQQKLQEKNKGVIVPALPEKSTIQKFQQSDEFQEERRRALQVFLNRVSAHHLLLDSKELATFLSARDEDWMLEMARWQAESNAAKGPVVQSTMQWLKGLSYSAQNMVSGRSLDSSEDMEYIKVRDYINGLEAHLAETTRQAGRLVKKEADLAAALSEFGNAAQLLGKFDGTESRTSFDVLCEHAQQVSAASRQRAAEMANSFEAPLKEMTRTVKSVQHTMADRAAALSLQLQTKAEVDAKKVKVAKLKGTPGTKEDKIRAAELEVEDAEMRLHQSKVAYDTLVARMTEELNRFQKERAEDMKKLLRDFAVAQARNSAENAKAWSGLLADIQQHSARNSS